MKQLRFNMRLVLIILAIFLGAGVLLLLVISPLFHKVIQTKEKIKANEEKLLEIAAEIANYKTLSANLLKVSETKTWLSAMFPAREEMVSLVLGLESAADRADFVHKLVITDFKEKQEQSVGAKEKPPLQIVSGLASLEEIPYQLQVSGSYRQLADLFLYLEHLPFITVPNKLTIIADQVQPVGLENLGNTGVAAARLDGLLFIRLTQ